MPGPAGDVVEDERDEGEHVRREVRGGASQRPSHRRQACGEELGGGAWSTCTSGVLAQGGGGRGTAAQLHSTAAPFLLYHRAPPVAGCAELRSRR
jgi:hypothetical protein